jgi:hypothetical protein
MFESFFGRPGPHGWAMHHVATPPNQNTSFRKHHKLGNKASLEAGAAPLTMFSSRGFLLLALAACASAVQRARSAGLRAAVARDAEGSDVPAVAAAAAAVVSDAEAALAHADAAAAAAAAALSSAGAALPRAGAAAAVSDAGAAVAHADAAAAAALGAAHADASALAPRFAGSAAAAEVGVASAASGEANAGVLGMLIVGAVVSGIQSLLSIKKGWMLLQGNALVEAQNSDLRDISAGTLRAVDALGAPLTAITEGLAGRMFELKRDLLIDILSVLPPAPAAVLLESVRDADTAAKNLGKPANVCRDALLNKNTLSPVVTKGSPVKKKSVFGKALKALNRLLSPKSTTNSARPQKILVPPKTHASARTASVSQKSLSKPLLEKGQSRQPPKAKSTDDLEGGHLASALAMAAINDFDALARSSAGLLGGAPDLCVLHIIAPALVLRAVELNAPADGSEHWAAALIADGVLTKQRGEDDTAMIGNSMGATEMVAVQTAGALGTTAMPMIANALGSKSMDAVDIGAGNGATDDATKISINSIDLGEFSGQLYQLNNVILGVQNIASQLLDIYSNLPTAISARVDEGERAIGIAMGTADAVLHHAQARACTAYATLRAVAVTWLARDYGMGGAADAELASADFVALFTEVASDSPFARAVSSDAALLARAARSAARRANDAVFQPLKVRLDGLFRPNSGRCAALDKAKWRGEVTPMLDVKEFVARRARVCVTPDDIYDVQLTTAGNAADQRWIALGYTRLTDVESTHADPSAAVEGSGAAATVKRKATDMIPNLELNGNVYNAQYRKSKLSGVISGTKSSGEGWAMFGVNNMLPATIFEPATEARSRVLLVLRCSALVRALRPLGVTAAEKDARAALAKTVAAAAAAAARDKAFAERRRKLDFFAALLAAGPITDLAVRRRPPITAGLDIASARNGRAMSPRHAFASFGAVVADIAQGYAPVLFTVLNPDELLPPVVTTAAPFPRRLAGDKKNEKPQPTVAPRSAVSVARSAYARLELALADVSAPNFGSEGPFTDSPIKSLEAANNELNKMGKLVSAAATDSLEDQVFQDMRYPSQAQRALHVVISRTGPSRITDVTLLPFLDRACTCALPPHIRAPADSRVLLAHSPSHPAPPRRALAPAHILSLRCSLRTEHEKGRRPHPQQPNLRGCGEDHSRRDRGGRQAREGKEERGAGQGPKRSS